MLWLEEVAQGDGDSCPRRKIWPLCPKSSVESVKSICLSFSMSLLILWLGESAKKNHQMRVVVVFFPYQKYPSHVGWKRKKKKKWKKNVKRKKKISVCFYSGSWGKLSRVLGCFIDIQECHLSKITTSSSLEVGSFSPLNHLTGFCQRGVNFKPLSSPSSHSLATIITIISAPSSFQMMDVLAPHLGLPRPGELASVCHSFMACPFCTDSWTQQTPEWAVLYCLSSSVIYLGSSFCLQYPSSLAYLPHFTLIIL